MKEPATYFPDARLQRFIACYGVLEVPAGISEPYFSPPLGLSGIIIQTIFDHEPMLAHIDDRIFFKERAVVTGQVTKPVYGTLQGRMKAFLIFFTPLGMYELFGNDMAELTNKSIPLKQFLGEPTCATLIQKLTADQSTDHQIKILDQFFINTNPAGKNFEKLRKVLNFIHERQGGVTVHDLEVNGCYHRKTLERHFRKMVGLSPKVYAQIYRFKSLIQLIQSQPDITWTQLADQAGYYDQSHMSRYVKEYLQVSPNSMVQLDMDFVNYLLSR